MGTGALGKGLMLVGLVLILVGALVSVGRGIPWLGRLPGDVLIQRDRFTLFLPLTTCLLVSVVVSLIAWLMVRR